MENRWAMLAVVVVARTAMGVQFQSLAAVGPFFVGDLGLSYAELGTLIGFYLLPGAFLALPGGALGARFGDRAVVLAALALMTIGGVAVAVSDGWSLAAGGRLVSGAGGVLLNMQGAKIVTDWFVGRELTTALGVMLSAWPLGIGLGLAVAGGIAAATTWRTAIHATSLFAAVAFVLMLVSYRGSPGAAAESWTVRRWWHIGARETVLTLVAGLAWGMLNAAFILVLSFGPTLLLERGMAPTAANLVVSWASFLSLATVPAGGFLLDRIRRRDALICVGLAGQSAVCAAWVLGGPAFLWSALVGILVAPAAGIVALPGEALAPASRSTGFGLFYAVYYGCMAMVPVLAGFLVDRRGGAAALWLAAILWLATLAPLALFRTLQRRWARVV
jgi:MFS family permease